MDYKIGPDVSPTHPYTLSLLNTPSTPEAVDFPDVVVLVVRDVTVGKSSLSQVAHTPHIHAQIAQPRSEGRGARWGRGMGMWGNERKKSEEKKEFLFSIFEIGSICEFQKTKTLYQIYLRILTGIF